MNRIINLRKLKSVIEEISQHSVVCSGIVELLGEKKNVGLASTLEFRCTKCNEKFLFVMSPKVSVGGSKSTMYSVNVGAVIGQISTGGGGAQLAEQMSAINQTFVNIERMLGDAFEKVVTSAGEEEKCIAIEERNCNIVLSLL